MSKIRIIAAAVSMFCTGHSFANGVQQPTGQAAAQVVQQSLPASVVTGAPLPGSGLPMNLPSFQQQAPMAPDVDKVMSDMFGLSPEQIRELRKQSTLRQKAASEYPGGMPKAVTSRITASTAPGSTPPVVRLFPGFATSLVVTDSSGSPWPIENFSVGHKDLFEVKRLDRSSPEGSALSIVPLGYYAQSNIILYLKGLSTPISVSFVSGQKEVDFRTELSVQGMGPNAQIAAAGLPSSTNSQLLSLLEGVAPANAKVLKTGTSEAQAWMTAEGKMFVRTKLPLISPAWIGSVRSVDGMTAYEMQPTSSLLVMREGRITTLSVEGW